MCGKNEQLEQRIDQYREEMEIQRQTYSSQQDQSSDFIELLRKKDKEMNAVLDQIEVCVKQPSLLYTHLSTCIQGVYMYLPSYMVCCAIVLSDTLG